jgi:hypothetical protein
MADDTSCDVNISSEDLCTKLQNDKHFSFVRYFDGELISVLEYNFLIQKHIIHDTDHVPNCDGHHYFKEMNKGLLEALTSADNLTYSNQHKYIFQVLIDVMIDAVFKRNPLDTYSVERLTKLKDTVKVRLNMNQGMNNFFSISVYDVTKVSSLVNFINILNTKNIILIGPEYLTKLRLLNNVHKYIFTPMHDCFLEKDRLITEISNTMDEFDNNNTSCVFLFAASMTTNYIVDKLFTKSLDKHTMIDLGSFWDNFMSKQINPAARRIYNPEFIQNNYPANYWHDE